jgi:hypothetical protein
MTRVPNLGRVDMEVVSGPAVETDILSGNSDAQLTEALLKHC